MFHFRKGPKSGQKALFLGAAAIDQKKLLTGPFYP
jgi:hypothetical protein